MFRVTVDEVTETDITSNREIGIRRRVRKLKAAA